MRPRLREIARRAEVLLRGQDDAAVPAEPRPTAERLSHVVDTPAAMPHEGAAAPLAAPWPDAIPMTGEEDPLVEVDDPEFAAIVAEFMRSERRAEAAEPFDPRATLAQALAPFAEDAVDADALLRAVEAPFARYAAALESAARRDPRDRALLESMIAIIGRGS